MRKNYITEGIFHRVLTSFLALVFVAAFMIGTVQEAEAATKYKTYYVPTKVVVKETGPNYSNNYTINYKYYTGVRAGLLRQETQGSMKIVYSRNAKGLLTGYQKYRGSRKCGYAVTTIEKGKVKKCRVYDADGELENTITYYYNGVKRTKEISTNRRSGLRTTTNFRTSGKRSKEKSVNISGDSYSSTTTYNNKGDATKGTLSMSGGIEFTTTVSNSYGSAGNLRKSVEKGTYKGNFQGPRSSVSTIQYSYTGDRITKIVQKTQNYEEGLSSPATYTTTRTYTYKKVRVRQNYWNMMDGKKPYVPGQYDSLENMIRSAYYLQV